jgi:glucose/arabinose dehydrogenase
MKKYLILFLLLIPGFINAQPRTSKMTPHKPFELISRTVQVPQRFSGILPANARVNLPAGFKASVFFAGGQLRKPRFMAWSPDGILHVADLDAQSIFALPDKDGDGIADTLIAVARNVVAHDIKFYKGALYAAQERSVLRLTDTNKDGFYESRSTFIDQIAEGAQQPGGGHTTRTIMFDSLRGKMYLSIGSLCNVCRSQNPSDRDYQRALIEEWNDDGTGRRTYASGIRNAVGLHMRGGRLWATNNGSDNQGNDTPPEWIDIVRDAGFYGYPIAHSDGIYFNFASNAPADYRALLPITGQDSALVNSMKQPAALIQAHSAPMAIESAHPAMPATVRNGVFVALRGSWNRNPATGGKVVYLDFDNENDTSANFVSDFLTGFMTDSTRSQNWGWARPVGLATDTKGNLYVGSDALTRFILLISPDNTSGINETLPQPVQDYRIMPFPAASQSMLHTGSKGLIQADLIDMNGRELCRLWQGNAAPDTYIPLAFGNLAAGMYFVRCKSLEGKESQILMPFTK